MPRARRRLFSRLLYSTLALSIIAWASTGVVTVGEDLWRAARERQETKNLAAALRDSNPNAREQAVRILLTKGSEAVLPYLLEAARDPHGYARAMACRALVQLQADPPVVVPVLTAAADDDQDEVRIEAAQDFGRVHAYAAMLVRKESDAPGLAPDLNAASLETLSRLLKDRASEVRAVAADALGEFAPDPMASAGLVAAARDKDRTVRFAAARALLKFHVNGNRLALETLLALVADPDAVPDRGDVIEVVKGLSDEAQAQAVTALVKLLRSDGDPTVRPDVINCLQSIGPRARPALPALEALQDDEDHLLRATAGLAMLAIAGKESPRAVAILIGIITDEDLPREWRMNAVESIRGVEPAALAKTTPILVRQLGDARLNVRLAAHEILGEFIGTIPAEMPKPSDGK